MSSTFQSSTNVPLFKGQKNHGLSHVEWQALESKLRFSGDLIQADKIMNALRLMANYPTGRAQLREIIASEQIFKIESSTQGNTICDKNFAGGFNDRRKTTIHSSLLDKSELLGPVLLHEMMHQRQPGILPLNPIIYDMEPQALDIQLTMEIGNTAGACASYRQSYEYNVQKWHDIIEGKRSKPAWAPLFVPTIPQNISTLCRQQLEQEAANAYIAQMAMLETQAQYMEDFTLSRQSIAAGDFSLPMPSYENLRSHGFYDSDAVRRGLTDFRLSASTKRYFRQTYPALNVEKVTRHVAEVHAEYDELHNAMSQLVKSLNGQIVPGMNVKEIARVASRNIRGLTCSKETKTILSNEMVNFFIQYRSGITPAKISQYLQERFKETYYHSDGRLEIKTKGIDKKIDALWKNAEKEGRNPYKATFDFVAHHSNLSVSAKWYQLSEIIKWHKNQYPETIGEKAQFRADLIKQMRRIIKMEGLPIVRNETGLQEALRLSCEKQINETHASEINQIMNDRTGITIV